MDLLKKIHLIILVLIRKPAYKYFQNEFKKKIFSREDYNTILTKNWNCNEELLKYLKADVKGLLEVVTLTSKYYFDKYSLNMTKYYTLPNLAIAVYFSNYNDSDHEIKMVKGIVEKEIRSAYKGGIVNNFNTNLIHNAYYYDMNSQYPNAMLKDMPLGNPIFTTENDLNNIFGFVYGKITPPSRDRLKILTIEHSVDGNIIFPNKPFYRWINSEQIFGKLV